MSWSLTDEIAEAELLQLNVGVCPGAIRPCGEERPLIQIASMRLDVTEPLTVCTLCAQEYNEYWDEMWRDYYGDRI